MANRFSVWAIIVENASKDLQIFGCVQNTCRWLCLDVLYIIQLYNINVISRDYRGIVLDCVSEYVPLTIDDRFVCIGDRIMCSTYIFVC